MWRVVLGRALAGSRPRERADGHLVCLAVEGGGIRGGAVSAAMGVVLEAAGSTGAFDRTYGVSAGALNGCALAVGQAALSATQYQDAASRGVINRMRPLMGRSVIDFELLFEQLIAARKPLSFDGLASGPEFRALATSLETLSLRVLAGVRRHRRADAGRCGRAHRCPGSAASRPYSGRADGGRRPDRADPGRDSAARGGTHPCARAALAIGGIPPAHTAKPRRVVHAARRAGTGRAAASPSSGLRPSDRRAPAGGKRRPSRGSRTAGHGSEQHALGRPTGGQHRARHRRAPAWCNGVGDPEGTDRPLLATGRVPRQALTECG